LKLCLESVTYDSGVPTSIDNNSKQKCQVLTLEEKCCESAEQNVLIS